ncbi:restriction endonuclease subunit S [Pseudomonas fluorescens]|uniref:restriction endonuclease subunit S n=1 Tax=Pseudomonas fluorescens TaxID=294 RepID=UPI00069377F9|nr:restriction endonuclease subunit S [Pseudomonas fluorescens]
MSELPTSWASVPLELIGSWGSGGTPPKGNQAYYDGGIPWAVIGDLRDGPLTSTRNSLSELGLANSSAKIVPAGTILIAMYGSIGKLAITKIECCTNQAIAFCYENENIADKKYLFYALKLARPELIELGQGASQQNISQTILKAFEIPLAPRAQQTRIAHKLDELLAQVAPLKARIDTIPALLKRFRQSVLAAAVSGQLTEDWREKNTTCPDIALNPKAKDLGMKELAGAEELLGEPLPSFWSKYALEQLVEPERGIPYGIVQTGNAVSKGVPTVRCGDVKNLFIDTSGLKVVSPDIEQGYKRTRLKGGEVLLAIRGSVGNVGVAPESLRDCNISREVAMIPTLPSVLPFYLASLLQSPLGQRLLVGKVRGVAQKGINLADVKRLPVALPPYEEQIEILRRVEQLLAYADQLEAKVASAKSRIDNLTHSILVKAFRGELVPQDPNDEPASVLLERIQAQHAAAPKAKRGRKST